MHAHKIEVTKNKVCCGCEVKRKDSGYERFTKVRFAWTMQAGNVP